MVQDSLLSVCGEEEEAGGGGGEVKEGLLLLLDTLVDREECDCGASITLGIIIVHLLWPLVFAFYLGYPNNLTVSRYFMFLLGFFTWPLETRSILAHGTELWISDEVDTRGVTSLLGSLWVFRIRQILKMIKKQSERPDRQKETRSIGKQECWGELIDDNKRSC